MVRNKCLKHLSRWMCLPQSCAFLLWLYYAHGRLTSPLRAGSAKFFIREEDSPDQMRYLVSSLVERDAFFLSSWKLNRFQWRSVSAAGLTAQAVKVWSRRTFGGSACVAQQRRSSGGVVAGEHSEVEMVHRRARLIRLSTTRGGSRIELVDAGLGSGVLTVGLTGCIITSSAVIWKLKTRGSV